MLWKRVRLDWLRRRELLPLSILGFAVALALGLVLLSREIETTQKALRNGNWLAVQIEVEFQRFLKALVRYSLDDPEISYGEMNQRFDIFWSRLLLTREGRDGADLRDDTMFPALIDELERAVHGVEPFVLELSKGDRAAYQSIFRVLQPFEPRVHQLVQHLMLGSEKLAREQVLETRYWEIMAAFAGIMLTGALLVLSHMRERRRSEGLARAERTVRERAETESRAKSTLLAVVSHELRTPLNAVIGFSDLMRSATFGSLGDARYAEYAGLIHSSGMHLLDVVNSILDIARIESGSLQVCESDTDLNQVALACIALVEPRACDKHLVVLRHLDPALPPVRSDERLVRQIVINLLANAVKFTPEHGRIEVRTGLDGERRPFVEVHDTGIGIPAEDLARVFQPFVQVDRDAHRRYEGTGLGLAISKGFAEALGGTLSLASTPGAGTVATVTLPRLLAPSQEAALPDRAVA